MSLVIENFLKILTEISFRNSVQQFFVNNDRNIVSVDIKIQPKILSFHFTEL